MTDDDLRAKAEGYLNEDTLGGINIDDTRDILARFVEQEEDLAREKAECCAAQQHALELIDERDALQARLDAVKALHARPVDRWCYTCESHNWPCPTYLAATKEPTDAE